MAIVDTVATAAVPTDVVDIVLVMDVDVHGRSPTRCDKHI